MEMGKKLIMVVVQLFEEREDKLKDMNVLPEAWVPLSWDYCKDRWFSPWIS